MPCDSQVHIVDAIEPYPQVPTRIYPADPRLSMNSNGGAGSAMWRALSWSGRRFELPAPFALNLYGYLLRFAASIAEAGPLM